MTRSSDSPLINPFSNPERLLRAIGQREPQAPVNLFVEDNSNIGSTGDDSSDSVLFEDLFEDLPKTGDLITEEVMEARRPPLTMAEKMRATATGQGNAINQGNVLGDFEVKGAILNMIAKQCQFGGDKNEDANEHLRTFTRICGLFKLAAVNDQLVFLRLFPWTLKGEARKWLDSLPEGSITTWDGLTEKFLGKYFPASRAANLQQEINQFRQKPMETYYEAFNRYCKMLRGCPQHGLDTFNKVKIFYKGCDVATRTYIDQCAGGSIMKKTEDEAWDIIEKQAEYAHEWHEQTDPFRAQTVASSSSTGAFDDFASINAKLDGFGRTIEKINRDVHAMKVGCEFCGGLHLGKDCDAGLTMAQKEEIAFVNQGNNNQFQGRAQYNRNFNNPYNPPVNNNNYNNDNNNNNFNRSGPPGFYQQNQPGMYNKPNPQSYQEKPKKTDMEIMMEQFIMTQTQTNKLNDQTFRNQ